MNMHVVCIVCFQCGDRHPEILYSWAATYIPAKSLTLEIEEYIRLALVDNFTQLLQCQIEESKINECILMKGIQMVFQ
jgi:hypothetical protein